MEFRKISNVLLFLIKVQHHNIRLIRDYWCLKHRVSMWCLFHVCKHPSPCGITASWHHVNINCNSKRFTQHKLSISEKRPCKSHRCPTDTNEVPFVVKFSTCEFEFIAERKEKDFFLSFNSKTQFEYMEVWISSPDILPFNDLPRVFDIWIAQ